MNSFYIHLKNKINRRQIVFTHDYFNFFASRLKLFQVKEMWLTKLKVDSIIGQENLNLMRLRRTNLDRVERSEKLEELR